MRKTKCPKCKREIDLDKPQSILQKWKNRQAKKYANEMSGTKMPELKNYYCDCGLHITFIKIKGEWKWITAS